MNAFRNVFSAIGLNLLSSESLDDALNEEQWNAMLEDADPDAFEIGLGDILTIDDGLLEIPGGHTPL